MKITNRRKRLSHRMNESGDIPIDKVDKDLKYIKGGKELNMICMIAGIDCRRCLIGIDSSRFPKSPRYGGIVIDSRDAASMEQALQSLTIDKVPIKKGKKTNRVIQWQQSLARFFPNMPLVDGEQIMQAQIKYRNPLDEPSRQSINGAVIAQIRVAHTNYNEMRKKGFSKDKAKILVAPTVKTLFNKWMNKEKHMMRLAS